VSSPPLVRRGEMDAGGRGLMVAIVAVADDAEESSTGGVFLLDSPSRAPPYNSPPLAFTTTVLPSNVCVFMEPLGISALVCSMDGADGGLLDDDDVTFRRPPPRLLVVAVVVVGPLPLASLWGSSEVLVAMGSLGGVGCRAAEAPLATASPVTSASSVTTVRSTRDVVLLVVVVVVTPASSLVPVVIGSLDGGASAEDWLLCCCRRERRVVDVVIVVEALPSLPLSSWSL
jgi:hypothetical protein